MSSVVLTGDTSGSGTITVPAVAGTFTATIGSATGTHYPFTAGTVVTPTSGTAVNFANIPSWVKRITVMLDGVLFNANNQPCVQIGDSGGIENTGYVSFCTSISATANTTSGLSSVTASFPLYTSANATSSDVLTGSVILTKLNGNTWTVMGNVLAGARGAQLAGSKTLSDTLTQLTVTTSAGTATFTAGSINILYE